MEIILNPLLVISELDETTPLSVLIFLEEFFKVGMNIKYIKLDDYFETFKRNICSRHVSKILLPLTELKTSFLNPFISEEDWSIENAEIAYRSYIPYLENSFYLDRLEIENFRIGNKTNDYPESINEIMLYRICRELNYKTDISTSVDEMAYVVENYFRGNIGKLRYCLIKSISQISDINVLKISYDLENQEIKEINQSIELKEADEFNESNQTNEVKELNKNVLISVNSYFNSLNLILSRILPLDETEAIILAIKRWGVCIHEAENPVLQYKTISKVGLNNYIPINDINFKVKYLSNKEWYNYDKNWFKEFIPLYDYRKILDFSINEGLKGNGKKESFLIAFLLDSMKTSNFYFEVIPYSKQRFTYVDMTDIEEVENLICIGNFSFKEFLYFTPEELIRYFNHKKQLIDPITKNFFNSSSLNKLKNLCNLRINSKKSKHIYSELLKTMMEVEKNETLLTIKFEDILSYKNEMVEILTKIRELSFIMRGKKINNVIPINSFDSMVDEGNFGLVFQQSFDFYKEIESDIENSQDEIKRIVNSIKIITFSHNGAKVQLMGETLKAPNTDYSVSLVQCIKRVFYGEYENDNVCIRNSSNWILYTTSWYLKLLDQNLEYKMDEIDEIS